MKRTEIDVDILRKIGEELIQKDKEKVKGRKSNLAHYYYSQGIRDCVDRVNKYLIAQLVMQLGIEQEIYKIITETHQTDVEVEKVEENRTLTWDKIEHI